MNARRLVLAIAVAPAAVLFFACSDPPKPAPAPTPGAAASGTPPPPVRGAAVASASASASASTPKLELREDDFAEGEHSRDPFRSFATLFAKKNETRAGQIQRSVMLDRFSVDELKLVGLVTHTGDPRAMLLDPTGRGWVVTKGQYVGRAEIVHSQGQNGADYEVNWRVDRIRDVDIVLVREDATHADVPAATKVVALRHDKGEDLMVPQ